MEPLAILMLLALERPPMPTVLLSMEMAAKVAQLQCGECLTGCLRFSLPEITCVAAPPGGCINMPCTVCQTCEPKPRPKQ